MASRSIPKARCSANRPFGRSRRLPSNRPPTAPSRTCGTSSIACAAAARPTPPSGPPWRLRAPRIWPTPPGARRRSGRPDRFPVCRRGPPCPRAASRATMDFMLAFRLALALFSLSAFAAEAPKLRLPPDDIRPIKYAADLTLVPGDKTFAGAIDIDISLAKPASLIWLNATDLTIQQATIASEAATIEPGNADFVGLRAANILAPGPARIHIVYQGKISEKSSAGIFQG